MCSLCHSEVSLIELAREGFVSTFAFHCSNARCKGGQSFPSCPQIQTTTNLTVNSINRRATFAMRCIGCDHSDLRIFCGIMNIPPPAAKNTHQCIINILEKATKYTMEESIKDAGKKEYDLAYEIEDDKCQNIDVSGDGT